MPEPTQAETAAAKLVIEPTLHEMRSLNVAQAKAQLSALLVAVESGEDVEITRRGIPVARLTRATEQPAAGFDLEAFLAATRAQPLHKGHTAATLLEELREGARY
jgi:prevent-host-death family protein